MSINLHFPRIDDILRVLSSYAGRDKALRTIGFGLILISTKTKRAELAKSLLSLARQISQARTVCRQLNHLSLIVASRKLYSAFLMSSDKVDSGLNLFVMVVYVFYQFFELAGWLADAKIVNLQSGLWYKLAIYSWVAALAAGIVQILRRIFFIEPAEELKGYDKQREVNRRLDRLSLVGLTADLIAGLNLLPDNFLWAGKLSQRTSATLFFVASVVGLYKLF